MGFRESETKADGTLLVWNSVYIRVRPNFVFVFVFGAENANF